MFTCICICKRPEHKLPSLQTDLKEVGAFVNEHAKAFLYQVDPDDGTPYKKFYDPRKYLRLAEQGIVTRLQEAFEDLGSSGKSIAS